jgi:hypothetical protein
MMGMTSLILGGRCNSWQVLSSRGQIQRAEALSCDVDCAGLDKLEYVSKMQICTDKNENLQRG